MIKPRRKPTSQIFGHWGLSLDEYNGLLNDAEKIFAIERDLVDLRDALAYGRLLSVGDIYPATLYKFGIAKDGEVPRSVPPRADQSVAERNEA
jgi:hypothetical protein